MTVLVAYRDDGPLAPVIGRTLGRRLASVPASLLTLAGAVLLAAAFAGTGGQVTPWLGVATVGHVLLAGVAAGHALAGQFDWLVPPLLRAAEYGTLLTLVVMADPAAVPACFALFGVLAFHHYDTVYRLRHQGLAPPQWIRYAGGGWELRLLVAYALLLAGGLAVGMVVAAIALGGIYITESVASWRRFSQAQRPAQYEEEEDEAE
ncbi:hypothetical protein SAMN06265360_11851 [Haloechinothrix alba]|uniref:DUF5941 domain-containing protein n=1 Tax=Haloechinothrix alba TaxID=664784 RepID=A0A238Z0I5_9PSEU|nr:hypothetical protein SAMN06265360_11851 [Haloechinothrix alba]